MSITVQWNGTNYATAVDNDTPANGINDADDLTIEAAFNGDAQIFSTAELGDLFGFLGTTITDGSPVDAKALIAKAAFFKVIDAKKPPTDIQKALAELIKQVQLIGKEVQALENRQTDLEKKIGDLEKKAADGKLDPAEEKTLATLKRTLEQVKEAKKFAEVELKKLLDAAKTASTQARQPNGAYKKMYLPANKAAFEAALNDLDVAMNLATDILTKSQGHTSPALPPGKAAAGAGTPSGGTTPGTPGQPKAGTQPGAPGAPGAPGTPGTPKAGTGLPGFDPAALQQWWNAQDIQLSAQDDMQKMQNQSNKMMMLFFFLAQKAMSGDIGDMYQFLRLVGYIISKDKAMQNVQLAKKLIELQDQSRKISEEIAGTKSFDPNNPQVQADYQAMLETKKGEQGVIGTEQKLISGMLEEMAQVSEMMTNMTKALLDARGRELQVVSSWRV
ncbi:MAG: hypothetical protein HY696_02010 [Deltaproteobacteria bacterium]|nr:hypothetical protein [Deltaproteobacteria bacterium]